jgi:hypothetical protein
MTKEEFIEKYGNILVKFTGYYKYTFTFGAELEDGSRLSVGYGGNADAIYRYEVSPDSQDLVQDIYPYEGSVHKDGVEVDSFYDY